MRQRTTFPVLLLLILVLQTHVPLRAQDGITAFLQSLGARDIRQLPGEGARDSIFQFYLSQPLDHRNPDAGSFYQKIFLTHLDPGRPVVFSTEGYSAPYYYTTELAASLDCNQLMAEHRYFGASVPDSLDWAFLDTWQSASDHHRIMELFKAYYPENWITTGISKGGQTVMYHSFYYPDDADLRVPYVAPLNFSREDPRIYRFLDEAGKPWEVKKIMRFQKMLLKYREDYLPEFRRLSERMELDFNIVGGLERAYEYCVLEYSFAYWQWGYSTTAQIPGREDDPAAVMEHLNRVGGGFDYFGDQDIRRLRPFYYQALTEMGYYGYRLEDFEPWLQHADCRDFSFTLDMEVPAFKKALNHQVAAYLEDAPNFIFIYGEKDTWSATRVARVNHPSSRICIKEGGSHRTRINNMPPEQRDELYSYIRSLLEE